MDKLLIEEKMVSNVAVPLLASLFLSFFLCLCQHPLCADPSQRKFVYFDVITTNNPDWSICKMLRARIFRRECFGRNRIGNSIAPFRRNDLA